VVPLWWKKVLHPGVQLYRGSEAKLLQPRFLFRRDSSFPTQPLQLQNSSTSTSFKTS
jgi:hypothetical protein